MSPYRIVVFGFIHHIGMEHGATNCYSKHDESTLLTAIHNTFYLFFAPFTDYLLCTGIVSYISFIVIDNIFRSHIFDCCFVIIEIALYDFWARDVLMLDVRRFANTFLRFRKLWHQSIPGRLLLNICSTLLVLSRYCFTMSRSSVVVTGYPQVAAKRRQSTANINFTPLILEYNF